MAIVQLKKLTFCGMLKDKVAVLRRLHELGELHLIPLNSAEMKPEQSTERQAEQVVNALRYLNACARKRHQVRSDKNFNIDQVASEVLKLKGKTRELRDRYDSIQKRIHELSPWGDFNLPDSGLMSCQCFWFYIIPKRQMNKLQNCDYVWQTVYQNNLFSYVVVISETEPPESAFPVPRTHTGSIALSTLQQQANELETTLEDLQAQRESYTRWITLMTLQYHESLNHDALLQAQALTRDQDGVFALQAWCPEKQVPLYQEFAEQQNLALLVENPSDTDSPPTLLENPSFVAGGEDLVNFYQTPDYQGWDPSIVVFFSFSLFFAIILSDAGYAGVFALILAWKWSSLGCSPKGRRVRTLAANAIALSLIWGVLCGSYFGYAPTAGTPLSAVKFFDLNDFDGMMRLTIAIGVSHIALANAIKAWRLRHSSQALAPVGWIALVSGGFCYWLAQTSGSDFLAQTAKQMLIGGAVLLLLFTSARPVNHWSDWLWRLIDGIRSIISITQLFGDVLSYMRLFALGLASASLALTFNQLAEDVLKTLPGPGLLFSILILLLGHTLNLMLCVLSGLVHGLRLNFIEFYNWSVSDEGYPFKAFRKKGVD